MSDKAFLTWLKDRRCLTCDAPPPSDPAHVRLNGRGGVGMKPKYSAVPLCRTCHQKQHDKGHLSLMSKDEWLYFAGECLRDWCIATLK